MIGFQKAKICSEDQNKVIDLEEIVSDYSLQIRKNSIIPDCDREKLENFTKDLLTIEFKEDEKENLKWFQKNRNYIIYIDYINIKNKLLLISHLKNI